MTIGETDKKKPQIAISGTMASVETGAADKKSITAMKNFILLLGGETVIIDHHKPPRSLDDYDGVILMGNDYDLDPSRFDPPQKFHPKTKVENQQHGRSNADFDAAKKRKKFEEKVIAEAEKKHIPLFGVCGGMQRINVELGGSLIQHIEGLDSSKNAHKDIEIVPDSHLAHLAERANLKDTAINSLHHQAIDPKSLGKGLRVAATSQHEGQKLVEAVEAIEPAWYIMGVQWHPELMQDKELSQHLLTRFVKEAQAHQESRGANGDKTIVDRHVDRPGEAIQLGA